MMKYIQNDDLCAPEFVDKYAFLVIYALFYYVDTESETVFDKREIHISIKN